jgi:1-acyl-sn-glycerol-3-phosphate acyltransferase
MEKALRNGISTVIFPEGTRSANGEVGKFKRGAFQIAADLNLPVIPISLSGCYEVMKKGAPYVTRHPIHMHIGEPISPELFDKDHQTESIEMVREIIIKNMKQW